MGGWVGAYRIPVNQCVSTGQGMLAALERFLVGGGLARRPALVTVAFSVSDGFVPPARSIPLDTNRY